MWVVYVIAAWLIGGLGIWAILYAHGEDEASDTSPQQG
jgi:hypothetical protein